MSNFCSECGAPQKGNNNFCGECGNAIVKQQAPININQSSSVLLDQNSYLYYKESGKVDWIKFIISSIVGLVLVILVGYAYSFLLDKYTSLLSELKHTGGRGGLIIMAGIFLVPVIGIFIAFFLISYFGGSRKKNLNFIVYIALAIISWYYSTAFSLEYRFNLSDGIDSFPNFKWFPNVAINYVLEYAFTLSWLTSILHIIELGVFILLAYLAKETNAYYCEKCNKTMKDHFFYTLSEHGPDDYVKYCHKSKADFLAQTAYDKENILALQDYENKYIYYCNVHTCENCNDSILNIKRCEIELSGSKLKIEDKEEVVNGLYL